jgi:very-short-patch-repair endonuclease
MPAPSSPEPLATTEFSSRTTRERVKRLVEAHGGVVTAATLRSKGVSASALRWAVHTGLLHRLRHGVYTLARDWQEAGPQARHVLLLLAHQRVDPALVACAESAAVVWGLPLPSRPGTKLHLIAQECGTRRGTSGHRAGAVLRQARLADSDVVICPNGVRVTSAVRTVRDCVRVLPRPWGLALADAAVARGLMGVAELRRAVLAAPRAPGNRAALWVAEHVRARVESPLESLARAHILLAGLPEPTPQVWVSTSVGRFRVDMLDEKNGVITEADGRVKYDSPEVLWHEKRREDALRDRGYQVVRFTMRDQAAPQRWLAAYRRALARAAASRPDRH